MAFSSHIITLNRLKTALTEFNTKLTFGGTNIIHGTNQFVINSTGGWENSTFRKAGTGTVSVVDTSDDAPVVDCDSMIKLETTTAGTRVGVYQAAAPVLMNKSITYSVWCKGVAGDAITLRGAYSDSASLTSKTFTLEDADWHRYVITSAMSSDKASAKMNIAYMYYTGAAVGNVGLFMAPKLEYGSKVTDWTPAKSDITAMIPTDLGIIDAVYPVGSIYMSVSSTSPQTLFGGTWEQLKDRFLLGAGDTYTAGATGGEATHTLTTSEMPEHWHKIVYNTSSNVDVANRTGAESTITLQGTLDNNHYKLAFTSNGANLGLTSGAGGGTAHNNMPPYLAVYMWKRTA